ncbi:MAG TPA: 1,2-phenylacetyl-CoA epoxidase subunit PaaA [Chloroflexia bacterium]|jgi:ring-1,2-phenylacetyl-CoA epoxidase subunit PaaA|nr:1,2-phenylacetyl-CoA epoxidase subunit PaaA [Chloroflexia bacterium]
MDDPNRVAEFTEYVQKGGKVEVGDWMPEEYRLGVLKFVEMHANSELMGVLPEREWINKAPTLKRKLALTAKIQDEAGHAELLYRVAEDLGKTRQQMLEDLMAGKTKFHNVFHYPTYNWGDVAVIAWLVDAAAIQSQKALLDSSYAPYARTMQKICWEESFHIKHGYDMIITMMNGSALQRDMVQDALNRWWGPLVMFHGPPTPIEKDRDLHYRIKAKYNGVLRQEFLSKYIPKIFELGLTIPDPELHFDSDANEWRYTEPDWNELKMVVTGHGPKSQERLEFRRLNYADTQWVRNVLLGEAA